MTNYRNNCFNYRELILLSQVPEFIFQDVASVCDDAEYHDEEQFHAWISRWKKIYNNISKISNVIKKDRTTSASTRDVSVNIMKKLANSLINARQKMLDQRRAKRFPLQ